MLANVYLHLPPEVARGVIFMGGTHCFCHGVFFRMDLPLALELHNILFNDRLGFMVEDKME